MEKMVGIKQLNCEAHLIVSPRTRLGIRGTTGRFLTFEFDLPLARARDHTTFDFAGP
jgi:hypothetical protein